MDIKAAFAVAAGTLLLVAPLTAQTNSGSFTLAGKTYPFSVLSCDPEKDLGSRTTYTLYGRGKSGAGENFEIFVTRTNVDGIVSHGVTVRLTDAGGARLISRAARSHVSDAWVDGVGEPADGPLVQVEGNQVRAKGTFRDEHNEVIGDGVLEATCEAQS